MMNNYRVGRLSFGITLILAGAFSIMMNIGYFQNYGMVLKLWPFVLIILGAEILYTIKKGASTFKMDVGSVFMMIIVIIIAGVVNMGTLFLNSEYNDVLKNQIGLGETVNEKYDYSVQNIELESIVVSGFDSYQISFIEYDGEKIRIRGNSSYSKTDSFEISKDMKNLVNYDIEGKSLIVYSNFNSLYSNNNLANQRMQIDVMLPHSMNLNIIGESKYEIISYENSTLDIEKQ